MSIVTAIVCFVVLMVLPILADRFLSTKAALIVFGLGVVFLGFAYRDDMKRLLFNPKTPSVKQAPPPALQKRAPPPAPALAPEASKPKPKVQTSATPHPAKPDIGADFVKGASPGLVLMSLSDVVVRDPTYTVQAWNLTTKINLPAYSPSETSRFIKRDTGVLEATLDNPNMKSMIKTGDEVLALITVDCPECVKIKFYWLFVVYGGESWYSQIPEGVQVNFISINHGIVAADWNIDRIMESESHGPIQKPKED